MPQSIITFLVILTISSPLAFALEGSHVRMGEVALHEDLPTDLTDPEGRSRWDLSTLSVIGTFDRRCGFGDDQAGVQRDGTEESRWVDPTGGDAVERWLFPQDFGEVLRPGARQTLELEERLGDRVERLMIQLATVGIGWVHLPAKPHEVALQRVLVMRELPSGHGFFPERLTHRWIDSRVGVVAEVSGPVSQDGLRRLTIDSVAVVEEVFAGAGPLRIYTAELDPGPLAILTLRRNRTSTMVADVTANQGVTDIMSLISQGTWDFDIPDNRAGDPSSQSSVILNGFESCNLYQCGYFPGMQLGRRDTDFGTSSLQTNNDVTEIVLGDPGNPATDPTVIWFRAGAQKEGVSGAFGAGESRLCYTDKRVCAGNPAIFCRDAQDCVDAGTSGPCDFDEDLTESPLWVFPHWDGVAGDWYLESGDAGWSSGVFNCEQNIYNQVCGGSGVFDRLWTKDCTGHAGTQSGEIIAEGVVTLPSGHTVNSLVVRTVADFCVYLGSGCSSIFQVDEVRTAVYLWQVPHLSTVALIQSEQNTANVETFSTVAEASFAVGLLPPVSIQLSGETDDSIGVSWNPGKDLLGIDEFRVYWDTDSGSVSDYENSIVVPANQTTATIGGLESGTEYFVTVTAISHFNPFPPAPFCRQDYGTTCTGDLDCGSNGPCILADPPATTYESIRFPTQVSGDPDHVYPVEVQTTTTGSCIPTEEVANLTVAKVGPDEEFCWDSSADSCTIGYNLLRADTPQGTFSLVAQTGMETCWAGSPQPGFFEVVARGTGGVGP